MCASLIETADPVGEDDVEADLVGEDLVGAEQNSCVVSSDLDYVLLDGEVRLPCKLRT